MTDIKSAIKQLSPDVSFVTDDLMADLARFKATAEDDNTYDLAKIKMIALSKAGLISHTSRGFYMITDFGEAMINASTSTA